jgi:hypothetical protein
MNIRCLNQPRESITTSLSKWSRKLKIPLTTKQTPIDVTIIIGDGIPDDIVWLILTHKFNGKHTIGLIKPPEWLGLSSINAIPKLIGGGKINSIIVAADQETSTLQQMWKEAEKSLKDAAIKFEVIREEERLRVLDCTHADYKFKTLIVVNGIDNLPSRSHTIEDHLLQFYKETTGEDLKPLLEKSEGNPKEAWKKLKDREEQIYQKLLTDNRIEQVFNQHTKALKTIETKPTQRDTA